MEAAPTKFKLLLDFSAVFNGMPVADKTLATDEANKIRIMRIFSMFIL